MSSSVPEILRRLPLHDRHSALGARMGAFGEWEVPLYFSSILEEHTAVRERLGVFDISHMGEFFFSGPGCVAFLEKTLPRPIESMKEGQALYMPLLNEQGGIVDDIIVYRRGPEDFLWIVNAGNVATDEAYVKACLADDVTFVNGTADWGLLALQGPESEGVIRTLFGAEYADLPYYTFKALETGMISRTGYTGEDGFELMIPVANLGDIWDRLFEEGRDKGICPIGFGARDTLRLEAGMMLHGHDMNDRTTPVEAGIAWAVSRDKSFPGSSRIAEQREEGPAKKMIGFEMVDRGIPREGYRVLSGDRQVGTVTSGTFSPTLKKNIGIAYVEREQAKAGVSLAIEVRNRLLRATVVKLPFYRSSKRKKIS